MKKTIYLLFSLFVFSLSHSQNRGSSDSLRFPKPVGYVNDFEKLLTENQMADLTKIITDYQKETGNQICIVTTPSISPYADILSYATDLSNEWGVGQKEKNNGLTIVLSVAQRGDAIATGLETAKKLTDLECKNIREIFMIPEYKKGLYYEGLKKGLEELIKLWGK